jgi:hypothetical protein
VASERVRQRGACDAGYARPMWNIESRDDLQPRYEGQLGDNGPKPFMILEKSQLLRLRDFAIEHPGDLALIDEGSGYARVVLFGPDGEVVDSQVLPLT